MARFDVKTVRLINGAAMQFHGGADQTLLAGKDGAKLEYNTEMPNVILASNSKFARRAIPLAQVLHFDLMSEEESLAAAKEAAEAAAAIEKRRQSLAKKAKEQAEQEQAAKVAASVPPTPESIAAMRAAAKASAGPRGAEKFEKNADGVIVTRKV